MKKIKLSELNLKNAEVLTREQLKKILGGLSSGGGTCSFNINCIYDPTCGDIQGSPGTCTGAPVNGSCVPTEQLCYEEANAQCAQDPCCGGCVPY